MVHGPVPTILLVVHILRIVVLGKLVNLKGILRYSYRLSGITIEVAEINLSHIRHTYELIWKLFLRSK